MSHAYRDDPRRNHLLAVLTEEEYQPVAASATCSDVARSGALRAWWQDEPRLLSTNAIVSALYIMEDGASAEMAVVGNEGIVGIPLFMGGETTTSSAVVQCAGKAYRLKGELLKQEFNRSCEFQHLLLRYTQALLTQMAQTAVCNRHHSLEQQFCRCLLLSLDRLSSNEVR